MEKEQVAVDEAVETVAEENTRAYSKTVWNESTPITADKLNKIEDGIASALPISGGTLTGNVVLENDKAIGGKNTSGTVKWLAWVDKANNAQFGDVSIKSVINSNANPEVNIGGNGIYTLYHTGNKPTAAEIGALPLTGGTLTGDLTCNQYLNINAWSGYGTGAAKIWYDATATNNRMLRMTNVDNIRLATGEVYSSGGLKPTPAEIGALPSGNPSFRGNMIQTGEGGQKWIYHINAGVGSLNIAPQAADGTNNWDSQIMFDRSGVIYCNGRKKVPTMADQHAAHYMFRYGSGLGGANGYITFSY